MTAIRRRLWLAAKTLLAVAIILLVARQFSHILRQDAIQQQPLAGHWAWLFPAGGLYLFAHTLWGLFWVKLLRHEGMPITLGIGLRTYFLSQFGKYIPGKVAVIVMRTEMLRSFGCPRLVVAVTATLETLTSMAAGALIALTFFSFLGVIPEDLSQRMVGVGVIAGLPVVLVLLHASAKKLISRSVPKLTRPLPIPPLTLLMQGLLLGSCGWALLGLSLGCTIRAVLPERVLSESHLYFADLASVAISYVIGFIIPTPGGLGSREYVLQKVLALRYEPFVGEQALKMSVLAALALRLAWTVAEVGLGSILYLWKPTQPAIKQGYPTVMAEEGQENLCHPDGASITSL